MILNDEVSANAILNRATRHYTVVIKPNKLIESPASSIPD